MRTDVAHSPRGFARRRDPRAAWICLGLAAAVLGAFWPVSGNEFIDYDDNAFIFLNRHVPQGLTPDSVRWAFTTLEDANWFPVTRLGFLASATLFGLRPGAHHLVSLLCHILAALSLFLALHRMTGRLWPTAFAAGLFALHPLRVESVAWAAELKDTLSGVFFGLTLLCYAAYARRPSLPRYLAVAAAFALGLMSKPTIIPLPLVLLLLDFWPLRRLGKTALVEKLPLALLAVAAGVVTWRAQALGGGISSFVVVVQPAWRFANALVSAATYLVKMAWPTRLAVFYPHPGTSLAIWKIAAAAAFLLLVSAAAVRQARRRPHLLAGWLWYGATLAPASGIVQAGFQGMADRYTYLPLIGVTVALSFLLDDLLRLLKAPAWLPRAGALAILAAFATLTRVQVGHWRTSETLFRHALAVTERNWVALSNVGIQLAKAKRYDEAQALYRESLAIQPGYGFTYYVMANTYREQGRLPEALATYRTALGFSPGAPEIYNNLGSLLAETGQPEQGAQYLRTALRLRPEYPEAASNLRVVLAMIKERGGGRR